MVFPDFITHDPDDGEMRLTGHRIGVEHIVWFYNDGYSVEMLFAEFPSLPSALIHKVIAFYLENRSEVDAYIAMCERELEQQRATAKHGPSLAELRKRLEAMHAAEAK